MGKHIDRITKRIKTKQIIGILIIMLLLKVCGFYFFTDVTRSTGIIGGMTILLLANIFLLLLYSGNKRAKIYFNIFYVVISLIMYIDISYYHYFNQLPSVSQIFQFKNLLSLDAGTFKFSFNLLGVGLAVFEIILVVSLFGELKNRVDKNNNINKFMDYLEYCKVFTTMVLLSIIFFAIDPFDLDSVKAINKNELLTYHVHDLYTQIFGDTSITVNDEIELSQVISQYKWDNEKSEYFGIGKNKNLIVIQAESLQNFVINNKYRGQEITPNLNRIINENSLYFNNYYQNIGKGNTSDAEFVTMNSLYPVIENSVYNLYGENTFYGLPWIMKENGYNTNAFHNYYGYFWNRDIAYINQGYDMFISLDDFEYDKKVSFGLADESMFRQTLEYLVELENPFFSFIVTLSCHYPYIMEMEDTRIELHEDDVDTLFGNYLNAVNYADECLGNFINDLKKNGLYDNSIIAIYGDHHGLNFLKPGVQERMNEYLGHDYDYDEMLNVPLIIHIPNLGYAKEYDVLGGQIDFLPTIADIMGVEIKNPYILGQNLLSAKEGFIASVAYMLRGSFAKDDIMFQVSREGIFEGSRMWNRKTHEELEIEGYEEYYERARKLVDASKFILENNLITR